MQFCLYPVPKSSFQIPNQEEQMMVQPQEKDPYHFLFPLSNKLEQ